MKYSELLLVCFLITFFVFNSCFTGEKETKNYLEQNNFYFKGKIIDCKSMSIANHLLLVQIDSISFQIVSNKKCHVGAIDKQKKIIAFYGRFDYQKQYPETNPILPNYIEVDSKTNRISMSHKLYYIFNIIKLLTINDLKFKII